MVEKKNWKKAATVAGIIGLVAGGFVGASIGYNSAPINTVEKVVIEYQDKVCPEAPVCDVCEVAEPVIETVTEYVASEDLPMILEHIYDNDGNVEYLLDDLDDDEIDLIVARVAFINEIKDLAIEEAKKEAVDELNKESFGEVTFDDDDIERVRVKDDHDDVIIDDIDFKDFDADVIVTVKFEQDDIKYEADFMVEIKDAEAEDIDLLEIRER